MVPCLHDRRAITLVFAELDEVDETAELIGPLDSVIRRAVRDHRDFDIGYRRIIEDALPCFEASFDGASNALLFIQCRDGNQQFHRELPEESLRIICAAMKPTADRSVITQSDR